jgi:OmpA-OmpF porin, OOP family
MRTSARISLFAAIFMALMNSAGLCLAQAPALPSYVTLPAQVELKANVTEEDYGEVQFPLDGQSESPIEMGKHWSAAMRLTGVPADLDDVAVWARLKPSLVQSGWTVLNESAGRQKIARYQKNGHDTWMLLWIFSTDDLRMDLVEVGPPPIKLKLNKPAHDAEAVKAETGDFPYLSPIPGSQPSGGHTEDQPMLVEIDQNNHEQQAVGSGAITKAYTLPPSYQSPLFIFTVYRDALTQAGWKIAHQVQSVNGADMVLSAHYNADGRDIWATLHGGGENYSIEIADVGSEDIGQELDRDCHVALYGVYFDFNKATIRPDSDPVLGRVLALLQARPALKLEIQGHTDNVGTDDYNQKLSETRANAVSAWLLAKSISADRLTAKGYGMKMPIADNSTDEGRAKNRRVEIQKQGCTKN